MLLAEASAFNRGLLRGQLEMSGYEVSEASNVAELLQRLEREKIQVLIVGSDLLAGDPAGAEKIRKLSESSRMPVMAISNTSAEIAARKESGLMFDDHQLRFEREAMLQSLARLASSVNNAALGVGPDVAAASNFEGAEELLHA